MNNKELVSDLVALVERLLPTDPFTQEDLMGARTCYSCGERSHLADCEWVAARKDFLELKRELTR
jgi:hypothetical protein